MPSDSDYNLACFESMRSKCRLLVLAAQINQQMVAFAGTDLKIFEYRNSIFQGAAKRRVYVISSSQGLLSSAWRLPLQPSIVWSMQKYAPLHCLKVAPLKKVPCVDVFSATLLARTPSVGFAVYVYGRFFGGEAVAKQQQRRLWSVCFNSMAALRTLAAATRSLPSCNVFQLATCGTTVLQLHSH